MRAHILHSCFAWVQPYRLVRTTGPNSVVHNICFVAGPIARHT